MIDRFLKSESHIKIKSFGNSMTPILLDEDIVYFKKAKFSQIKTNDIITVKKLNKLFTHRIIYKTNKYLITKGDNNIISDGRIYPNQIVGRLYQIKRNGEILNPENIYLIQSSLYFAEIVKIKKALEKEKIDFVFLKGLPLHLYYEGAHPRRIYADCDILVSLEGQSNIHRLLIKNGFKKSETSYSSIHKILKNKETEDMYYKKINGVPVLFDVHYEAVFMMNQIGKLNELYPQKSTDQMSKQFLKERMIVQIQNENFPILSPPDLIIYLALHFFHHNYNGIFRLELLNTIFQKIHYSRRTYVSSSVIFIRKYKLENFVYPTFLLLQKYFKTPIPKKFMDSIKPHRNKMKYIDENILRINIFNDEPRIKAGVTRFKNLFYLSPQPLWRNILIIFNPAVIYSIFWVILRKLKRK